MNSQVNKHIHHRHEKTTSFQLPLVFTVRTNRIYKLGRVLNVLAQPKGVPRIYMRSSRSNISFLILSFSLRLSLLFSSIFFYSSFPLYFSCSFFSVFSPAHHNIHCPIFNRKFKRLQKKYIVEI